MTVRGFAEELYVLQVVADFLVYRIYLYVCMYECAFWSKATGMRTRMHGLLELHSLERRVCDWRFLGALVVYHVLQ